MRDAFRVISIGLFLVLFAEAPRAQASEPDATVSNATSAPEIERLTGDVQPFVRGHGELRRRVERERAFRAVEEAQKQALFERQDAALALLAGVERFEDMDGDAYAAFHEALLDLLAAQKVVVGQQLVCRRMRPVGSQIPENVCLTRDEIATRNDQTGDELRKHMQLQQVDYCVAGVCIE